MDAQPTAGAVTNDPPAPPDRPAAPGPGAAHGAEGPAPAPVNPRPAPSPGRAAAPVPPPHGHPHPYAHGPARPPRNRPLALRLLAPAGTLAGVAAAFAYVGAVDPNEPGHYPVCPLLRFTGLYCPGCGGLRSAHAFVHGDLPTALGANALAVAGYGLFAVLIVLWLVRAVRGTPMRVDLSPAWWWGIGAVLALFTLVRNLPFGSALVP
ncbi:DUF2752 domain-containing protein [Streptomyces sp. NPDC058855]|uniref:DUF2752 domain-containing protein n=1 Tax=Streptomyces sp. NPDC058855 TaxID=3346651 RepID=UPI00367D09C2